MTHLPQFFRVRNNAGAALMAVLWVVALLTMLVAAAALLLTQDLDAAAAKRQIFRARMIAEAALAIALNPDMKPDDPLLRRQISDDERYEVVVIGEDGLLNPNMLLQTPNGQTLMRNLLIGWGIPQRETAIIMNCLLDWTDQDDFTRINGAEKKEYRRNDIPFNRPFRSLEEMAMVRGMNLVEQAYPQWRNWFSVYASGLLDVNEARPEVIAAVTGVNIQAAQRLRNQRLGPDGLLGTQDDFLIPDVPNALAILGVPVSSPAGQTLQTLLTTQSARKRITVRVQVGDLRRELAVLAQGAGIGGGVTALLEMRESQAQEPFSDR
jgi:hypothetical protein